MSLSRLERAYLAGFKEGVSACDFDIDEPCDMAVFKKLEPRYKKWLARDLKRNAINAAPNFVENTTTRQNYPHPEKA